MNAKSQSWARYLGGSQNHQNHNKIYKFVDNAGASLQNCAEKMQST